MQIIVHTDCLKKFNQDVEYKIRLGYKIVPGTYSYVVSSCPSEDTLGRRFFFKEHRYLIVLENND